LVKVSQVVVVGRTNASGWVSAPFVLVPSDGVFGRSDLAALSGCHTEKCMYFAWQVELGWPDIHWLAWDKGGLVAAVLSLA
jgi:hypothetical protein